MKVLGLLQRLSFLQVFLCFWLRAWTALSFPCRFNRSTTTSTGSFVISLSSTAQAIFDRAGRRPLTRNAVIEKSKTFAGVETCDRWLSPAPHYEEIRKFLVSEGKVSTSSLLKQFRVQGWRWHTQSLAREAGRLHHLALKTNIKTAEALKDASDYVVGFNMMGLHKIEVTLFFPWMREKLSVGSQEKPELFSSFSSAMDALETDQQMVAELGYTISKNARLACDSEAPESHRFGAIDEVANRSAELKRLVQRMMLIEDTLLVPAIGAVVSDKEQKSFNSKVLRKLGLLDSRTHLVSMYEAVHEGNDPTEKELFEQTIPGISRKMIPRWKRKLYRPKTQMME